MFPVKCIQLYKLFLAVFGNRFWQIILNRLSCCSATEESCFVMGGFFSFFVPKRYFYKAQFHIQQPRCGRTYLLNGDTKGRSSVMSVLCSEGSNLTPAHHYADFRFKTYAPVAFRYFRELFGIRPDDYLVWIYFSVFPILFKMIRSNTANLPLNQGCQLLLSKRDREEPRNLSDPSKEWEQAVALGVPFWRSSDRPSKSSTTQPKPSFAQR